MKPERLQRGFFQLGFTVVHYERGNLGADDFVFIRSSGQYYEPAVMATYLPDSELIINTNSAKLTLNIPGKI